MKKPPPRTTLAPAATVPGAGGAEELTEGGYERKPRVTADAVEFEGTVLEQLPNATFRLQLQNGHKVLAHTAGRMRKHFIRIMPGDRVIVAISPYDPSRGRIVYRYR